jgi:Asp-tRNA(Asn)/Glu-tRNA(Gln) amidotransferase C subunit
MLESVMLPPIELINRIKKAASKCQIDINEQQAILYANQYLQILEGMSTLTDYMQKKMPGNVNQPLSHTSTEQNKLRADVPGERIKFDLGTTVFYNCSDHTKGGC